MPRFHNISGNRVQFTEAEETARDAEEAQAAIDTQARIDAETAIKNNKTSGKAKLKAGESLTDDEISALFGNN
tara:strand:+ start:390 stop:608 length:219 start_codon:yes stop_codon:yes gene_type:complete